MVFETVEAAALGVEGPDVIEGIYEVFDATGLQLILSSAGGPHDYSATVTLTEPGVPRLQSERLRTLLREYLEHLGLSAPPDLPLTKLLAAVIARSGYVT